MTKLVLSTLAWQAKTEEEAISALVFYADHDRMTARDWLLRWRSGSRASVDTPEMQKIVEAAQGILDERKRGEG